MNNPYSTRPYRPEDIEFFFSVLRLRPARRIMDFPSFTDLREIMAEPVVAQVWENVDRRAAGFAILLEGETYASLVFETSAEDPDLLAAMIAWGTRTCSARYRGEAVELTANAHQEQLTRIAALEDACFRLLPETVCVFQRDLIEDIPPYTLPPGYHLRALAGADEIEAWVDLHRSAFGTRNMTAEVKRAMMNQPDYDPALDLVAVAPDGSLAAYVCGSIDAQGNALAGCRTGFTDPVATHPRHQQKGLAKALLLETLARLRRRGMESARLSTSSENTAMQAAARSAGYVETGRGLRFARPFDREQFS
jgi:ribosomal protein S18 acetylase RimI-like enzyme